jgi:hypothetical protein
MFEEVIEKLDQNSTWRHENATLKIIDRLFSNEDNSNSKTSLKQEFESYGLFENDLQLIKDLIHNDTLKDSKEGLNFDQKVKFFE